MSYSKIKSEVFFEPEERPWEQAAECITHQLIGYDLNTMIENVSFEKSILNGGDGLFVSPYTSYGAVCTKTGVIMDIFTPVRKDFLDISHQKN